MPGAEVLWVDRLCYVGPDRRERRSGLRLKDRRREQSVGRPPSLSTALRQLRVRVLETNEPGGLVAFVARASATAVLANAYGCRPVGDILMGLVRKLAVPPFGCDDDVRSMIYAELARAEVLRDELPQSDNS